MDYAEKRSREEEAYDNDKNTKKMKSLSEMNAKSIEDSMKEINTAELNIGFKCYKCGQCNFQTLHKKSLVHHNAFAHTINLLNVVVKKQSEEKIDIKSKGVTVEDQTREIMIDEGPLMSGVIVEDQFEDIMEDEGSTGEEQIECITIANSQQIKEKSILLKKRLEEKLCIDDDVKTSHFYNSDSDTLDETMSSLPDISRSNSIERKSYPSSPSKSFIENDQSVEILDLGELFPHLIKKDLSDESIKKDMSDESINLPVDIDSPKSLRKQSSELSRGSEEENQFNEDTITSSIGLTPNCSDTDSSQPSSTTHEDILPRIKREEAEEMLNNQLFGSCINEEHNVKVKSLEHSEIKQLSRPFVNDQKQNLAEFLKEDSKEINMRLKKGKIPQKIDDYKSNCKDETSQADESYPPMEQINSDINGTEELVTAKLERNCSPRDISDLFIKPDSFGWFGLAIRRFKTPSDLLLKTIEEDFSFFGDLISLAWRKNDETHDIIVKYGDCEAATAAFVGLQQKYPNLCSLPPADIGPDQHGMFTLTFQDKHDIKYAGTKIEFFKHGNKNPLISKGEGKLVKVSYFDKGGAIEALKQNVSNSDFPELQTALESEVQSLTG